MHDAPDDEFLFAFDAMVESDPKVNRLLRRINRLEMAYPEAC